MNFMPAQIDGDRVKLPLGEVALAPDVRARLGQVDGGRQVIAGLRPESFEDAHLIGDARARGTAFRAKIDVVESMGSELYAYFLTEHEGVESQQLAELAEDAGTAEVPSSGEGQVVARLDPASGVKEGEEAELWVDASKIHLFDPQTGETLTRA
jgi:multiple sugar transport system ATP-binding protein